MRSNRALWLATPLFILLLPVLALAQIDLDPNGIGIYFDADATVVSTTAAAGETVQAYLIATNPSQSGEITWWQGVVYPEFDPNGPPDGLAWVSGEPTNGGFNYAMNMPGMGDWSCMAGSFTTPLLFQPITVLANLSIYILDDTAPILLFAACRYWDGEWAEDTGVPFYPSSGSSSLPVATINGDAPVAVEGARWGSVKSLYR